MAFPKDRMLQGRRQQQLATTARMEKLRGHCSGQQCLLPHRGREDEDQVISCRWILSEVETSLWGGERAPHCEAQGRSDRREMCSELWTLVQDLGIVRSCVL